MQDFQGTRLNRMLDRTFTLRSVEVLHGVDASVNLVWPTVINAYVPTPQFLIAAAWGGRTTFGTPAETRLAAAPCGILKAAYCLLNFDNSSVIAGAPAWQTGGWQVQQGIAAIGDEIKNINFISLDVEVPGDGTTLDQNLPTDPQSEYQRSQRVAEAVQAVLDVNKQPIIYTPGLTNGGQWQDITGNSTAFSNFPLWHARYVPNANKPPAAWDDSLDLFEPFLEDGRNAWVVNTSSLIRQKIMLIWTYLSLRLFRCKLSSIPGLSSCQCSGCLGERQTHRCPRHGFWPYFPGCLSQP